MREVFFFYSTRRPTFLLYQETSVEPICIYFLASPLDAGAGCGGPESRGGDDTRNNVAKNYRRYVDFFADVSCFVALLRLAVEMFCAQSDIFGKSLSPAPTGKRKTNMREAAVLARWFSIGICLFSFTTLYCPRASFVS